MSTNQRSMIAKLFIAVLALVLVLAACGQDPTPTPAPPEPPPEPVVEEATAVPEPAETTEEMPEISQPIYRWGEVAEQLWVLIGYGDALNQTVVEEGVVITAVFSSVDGTVGGSGGCNNYFTSYESTDDGSLTISGPIGSTMMACEIGSEAEGAYLAALETVSAWTLNEEGLLELTYDSGAGYEEKLTYAAGETPLTGTIWNLVSMGDPDKPTTVETGTSITAVFAPETDTTGTVGGSSGCNNYNGSYMIDGNSIAFGPIAGTRMMCPIGADQETAYLTALGSAQTFEIIGPNMQIAYDGGVLNFTSLNLPLTNILWQALVVAGQPVPEGIEITATFVSGESPEAGIIGGSNGCNNYSGSYTTSTDNSTNPPTHSLTIEPNMAMTMAACPDEVAELEQAYMAAIGTAQGYQILGDQMIVTTEIGDIHYAADREPLLGTTWQLVSLGSIDASEPPVEGSNFTAQFNRLPTLPTGTVVGETGCNDYNATFTADLTNIKVNLPAKTNNEECPWGTGNYEVEQQYFLALNSATSYRILGNTLQISYGEGQALNFVATQPVVEPGLDLAPLADTFWYLLSIGDNALIPYTEITAGFAVDEDNVTGTVSGSSGCNAYNGGVSTSDNTFAVGPIASTAKACSPEVMDQEGGYLDWLSRAYAYSRVGDQLLISTEHGVLTYNSIPVQDQSLELQNKTWYLVSVGNLTAVPGSGATTIFSGDGQSLSGNTGCNSFNGAYLAEPGNTLTISGFSSTRAACPTEELTKQEEALLIFLPSAISYTVVGNQMQIQTVDGSVINYTAIAPQEPKGPTAVIVSEDLAETGQPITFDGSQSTAGDTTIVRYDWDLGDGTFLNGAVVQHAYNAPGSFTVKLTVTDQAGKTSETIKSVQITPVVEVTPPTAVIEGPQMAFSGEQVTFSAANSQQGTAAITSYQWQSGDGNGAGPGPDSSFTTIYYQPGTYYVSVTVADASGLSDTASIQIVINASLQGTNWILNNTIPGTSISLDFGNGTLSGFGGCNNYNASYTTTLAAGNTNSISVGPVASTSALCSEEIMTQEQGYLAALQTASSYTINGNTITLTTANGPLTFSAAAVIQPYAAPAVNP